MKAEKREPRKPGADEAPSPDLEPIGSEEPGGGGRFGGMGQFVIPLVLALVVSWGMITVLAPSKSDYRADVTRLETDIVAMREVDKSLQAKDTGLTNLINSVKTNDAAQVAKVTALEAKYNALNTAVTGKALTTDLNALKVRVVALEKGIDDLEEEIEDLQASSVATTTTTTTATGDVTTAITSPEQTIFGAGQYYFYCDVSNDSSIGKKVYLQFTATPTASPTANVSDSSTVEASGGYFTVNTFTNVNLIPNDGVKCQLIGAMSDGYILMTGGTKVTTVIIFTLNYDAGGTPTIWNVSITPVAVNW